MVIFKVFLKTKLRHLEFIIKKHDTLYLLFSAQQSL